MKILVVDDEMLIRKSLSRALASKQHVVLEAENGEQALRLLTTENVDAVVLDLIMPIKSGYDVIAEYTLDIPFFIISAFTGPELSADYLKSDQRIQLFIKKPFENLFETVDLILNHLKKLGKE